MTSHDPNIPGMRDLFDRASARVDQGAAARLQRARQEALASGSGGRLTVRLVPAGAFAAAVLALGLAWWMPPRPATTPDGAAIASIAMEVDGQIADEDPELYAWLADAPVATRARGPQ